MENNLAADQDLDRAAEEQAEGTLLLEDVATFIRRFVVLDEAQATAIALWVVHTHAFEAADCTPYLHIRSAEKRSGKTRLLEVLELLVREPLPTANISDAALFRAIGAEITPTLLLDEADAIFGPKARDREDLRGLLNAGYRRGAVAHRMGGAKNTTLERFPVFSPKVFAGIGELPDTIGDRSISIRLERRTREEHVERFRRRDADEQAEPIHRSIGFWVENRLPVLAEARPELPDDLDDRAQDVWEPLLAIADLVGGGWPALARVAAVELSGPDARSDEESKTVLLLKDIQSVFEENKVEHYRSSDLIAELCKIEESPWGDWRQGKPITPQALSGLLRPHQIKTMPVWIEGKKERGYKSEQFAEAFLRVLGGRGGRDGRTGPESQNDLPPPTTLPPSENEGGRPDPALGAEPTALPPPTTLDAGESENGRLCPVCNSSNIGSISGNCLECGSRVNAPDDEVYGGDS